MSYEWIPADGGDKLMVEYEKNPQKFTVAQNVTIPRFFNPEDNNPGLLVEYVQPPIPVVVLNRIKRQQMARILYAQPGVDRPVEQAGWIHSTTVDIDNVLQMNPSRPDNNDSVYQSATALAPKE